MIGIEAQAGTVRRFDLVRLGNRCLAIKLGHDPCGTVAKELQPYSPLLRLPRKAMAQNEYLGGCANILVSGWNDQELRLASALLAATAR